MIQFLISISSVEKRNVINGCHSYIILYINIASVITLEANTLHTTVYT